MTVVWVTGQASSFVVYCMPLSAYREFGAVILGFGGLEQWQSCRDARYFFGHYAAGTGRPTEHN
jgi:hypothetical protein